MTTVNDIKEQIVLEVGDTPDQLLAALVDRVWDAYQDKQAIGPRLQELYTKKRLIAIARGALRNYVDVSFDGSLNLRLSGRTKYLTDQHTETIAEITHWETIYRASRPSLIERILPSELEMPPISPIPDPPPNDAGSPLWRGSPYWTSQGNGVLGPGTGG